VQTVPIRIDISKVSVRAGDFSEEELAEALDPVLEQVAEGIAEYAANRKTLVFTPLIRTADRFAQIFRAAGFAAEFVSGKCSDRAEKLSRFTRGETRILANAQLLCLDLQTEILTQRGFLSHSQLTSDDLVANWNFDGSVFFEKPLEIVRRPTTENERMISVQGRLNSLRVTETHRVIVRHWHCHWQKIGALEMVIRGKKSAWQFPTFGLAKPVHFPTEQFVSAPLTTHRRKRLISAQAYNLRRNNGYSWEESFAEAAQRLDQLLSLKRLAPHELSLDQCRLIGFWIADGTATRLQSGGIEYKIVSSCVYPHIIKWFDDVLNRTGYHYLRKERQPKSSKNPFIEWSFGTGRGGGIQERRGLFEIHHYLEKRGTTLFWGLNEKQFDALVEGYWYGDGYHGQAEGGIPKSVFFSDTIKQWLELLQAIGCVRNWRCDLRKLQTPAKGNHHQQWGLRMVKNAVRYTSFKTQVSIEHSQEEVWCVRTTSKNIVTRRNGKVTVLGNTEGYDEPTIDCIVILRPTRSRPFYCQMTGRGTRIHPGKQDLLILDFLWLTSKHNLIKPASLIAVNEKEAAEIERRLGSAGGDLIQAQQLANRDRDRALAAAIRNNAQRRARRIDLLELELSFKAPGMSDYEPTMLWHHEPPTERQLAYITRCGIDGQQIRCKGEASAVIDLLEKRRQLNLATFKQARLMRKLGHPKPHELTRTEAGIWITNRLRNQR
jgi:hypothetical protein